MLLPSTFLNVSIIFPYGTCLFLIFRTIYGEYFCPCLETDPENLPKTEQFKLQYRPTKSFSSLSIMNATKLCRKSELACTSSSWDSKSREARALASFYIRSWWLAVQCSNLQARYLLTSKTIVVMWVLRNFAKPCAALHLDRTRTWACAYWRISIEFRARRNSAHSVLGERRESDASDIAESSTWAD